MTTNNLVNQENNTENFILYSDQNGNIKVDVLLNNSTIWLTQNNIAEVFDKNPKTISKHIKNIFETNELEEENVVIEKNTLTNNGRRYNIKYYNLDMIISVGYRVDSERMKNGSHFGEDYFKELLETVRSIRASERRIWQQITDIFAECSIDYHLDENKGIRQEFFATVQNKFHYAITGQTAGEIISSHADATPEHMGLQTWKNAPNGRVLKSDTVVAKNYLTEDQIKSLERTVSSYFDFIEGLIERKQTFTVEEFSASINKFLDFNAYEVLT